MLLTGGPFVVGTVLQHGEVAAAATGVLLAWSLAALPGPANALIATEAARRGFASGMRTGLGAITADLAMFLLMWLGVVRVIETAPWLRVAVGAVGAVLLARFAWGAYRSAKDPLLESGGAGGYLKCFLVIVASPLNWVWWASAGTTIFAQFGPAVVFGFFVGLLTWVAFWTAITREGARRVARARRAAARRRRDETPEDEERFVAGFSEGVAYASAVVLAVFAAVVAWSAASTAVSLV